MTREEINKQLENIKNSDFGITNINVWGRNHKASILLRNALLCYNNIYYLECTSDEIKEKLRTELDEIMKCKFKELNPNFSEEMLEDLICSYKRGYVIYPMDILIVDNAVFQKEGIYSEWGNIEKVKTFMFENTGVYYGVFDMWFTYIEYNIFFESEFPTATKEDIMAASKFISDEINRISGNEIAIPIYELNNENNYYGYEGLARRSYGVNVYIDTKFYDIVNSLKEKRECDIKIAIQSGDKITLYYINQSFENDKPSWNVIDTNSEVWSLSEQALKVKDQPNESKKSLK